MATGHPSWAQRFKAQRPISYVSRFLCQFRSYLVVKQVSLRLTYAQGLILLSRYTSRDFVGERSCVCGGLLHRAAQAVKKPIAQYSLAKIVSYCGASLCIPLFGGKRRRSFRKRASTSVESVAGSAVGGVSWPPGSRMSERWFVTSRRNSYAS